MVKVLWVLFFIIPASYSFCQDSLSEKSLDEVIIYSGKFAEHKRYVAQKIDIIDSKQISQANTQTTADLLINTGNVFVQKSQQGGGSPVLRGFEASRVLLVVDGVRMNNAIYRAGHLQNVITIDQNMLESIEVIYGPGSTLYGSDALGGVLLMRTKQPVLSANNNLKVTGASFLRYSNTNDEKTAHVDLSIGGKKIAWLQSYNYSDFGDLTMGGHDKKGYEGFGRRNTYVAHINGIDTILQNKNNKIQKFSGYKQWDISQKLLYQPNEKLTHLVNFQLSNSTDIPRYDRLQDIRNGAPRYAEWSYGPQKRLLASYEMNYKSNGFFDEVKSIFSYQSIEESRHTRDYKQYTRFDHREENLNVWGFTIDGRILKNKHELTTGIDGQINLLSSQAYRENIKTGAVAKLDSRYPNGKNNMGYFGIYAQHLVKWYGGKLFFNDGIRFQLTDLRSSIADNSFFNFPFTSIHQKNVAITGNVGLVYLPNNKTKLTAHIASGFRSPNIDDLARIFESNSASRQLIIPNPDIKPERNYTFDIGFAKKIGNSMQVEINSFYTIFKNAIVLAPFQYNKNDSVEYNGSLSRVYANQNKNRAYLYGFSANTTFQISSSIQLYSTLSYTYGRIKNIDHSTTPLDHIPPLFGKTSIQYKQQIFDAEIYALYNGWKRVKDYSPSGEDNLQYATTDGTPSWITLNFRSSIAITKQMQFQFGIENIFDQNYRYFSSGISAPGRNFIVAIRTSF